MPWVLDKLVPHPFTGSVAPPGGQALRVRFRGVVSAEPLGENSTKRRKGKMSNATYLFEKPDRDLHNSESFWTSLFGLFLLECSMKCKKVTIPTYRFYKYDNGKWEFKEDEDFNMPFNLSFQDVIVEGIIKSSIFPDIPDNLTNIKPDLLVLHRDENELKDVFIFEIKTIGAHIHQKDLYEGLLDYFQCKGYNVVLFFLLSIGHENNSDWSKLAEKQHMIRKNPFRIIFWEDVLKVLCSNSDSFSYILEDIKSYTIYKKKDLSNK